MRKPVLAFDTSMGECSAALWHDGKIIATESEAERNRQTELLVPMIESVMKQAKVTLPETGLIVTTSGPGSFTGIRIGLAVARSLRLALHIPILAVSTLELLAWQAVRPAKSGTILSAINAYRGEVYVQAFRYEGALKPLTLAQSLPHDQLEGFAAAYRPFIAAGDLEGVYSGAQGALRPDAAALAEYAALHPLAIEDYPPQALYIRPPDAKLPSNPLALKQNCSIG